MHSIPPNHKPCPLLLILFPYFSLIYPAKMPWLGVQLIVINQEVKSDI
jgi:hypothetical protein